MTLSSSDQVSLDNEDPPGYFVLNGRLDLTTNNTMYSLQLNQDLDLEQVSMQSDCLNTINIQSLYKLLTYGLPQVPSRLSKTKLKLYNLPQYRYAYHR